jgi:hypothetical protein
MIIENSLNGQCTSCLKYGLISQVKIGKDEQGMMVICLCDKCRVELIYELDGVPNDGSFGDA